MLKHPIKNNIKLLFIALIGLGIVFTALLIADYKILDPYRKKILGLKEQEAKLQQQIKSLEEDRDKESQYRQSLLKEIDFLNYTIEEKEVKVEVLTKELKKVKGSYTKLTDDELYKELLTRFERDTILINF